MNDDNEAMCAAYLKGLVEDPSSLGSAYFGSTLGIDPIKDQCERLHLSKDGMVTNFGKSAYKQSGLENIEGGRWYFRKDKYEDCGDSIFQYIQETHNFPE